MLTQYLYFDGRIHDQDGARQSPDVIWSVLDFMQSREDAPSKTSAGLMKDSTNQLNSTRFDYFQRHVGIILSVYR